MRWIYPLLILGLCGFTQVYPLHDDQEKTDGEFINLYGQAQAKQFKVVASTPILSELQDHEVVLFSSGATKIMYRDGQEIYAIAGSCVTVRR